MGSNRRDHGNRQNRQTVVRLGGNPAYRYRYDSAGRAVRDRYNQSGGGRGDDRCRDAVDGYEVLGAGCAEALPLDGDRGTDGNPLRGDVEDGKGSGRREHRPLDLGDVANGVVNVFNNHATGVYDCRPRLPLSRW